MKKILRIFKIRKDERWLAVVAVIVSSLLNALTVVKYYGSFSQMVENYRRLFVRTFRVSGFDPLTYEVVSNWDTAYNVYRHPLLAFFMYPVNQVNQGMMMLTGSNWVATVTAVVLVGCSVYSAIFLFRIFREVIGVTGRESYLLVAMYFSFSFVMLSTMVPDHFVMSMMALLLTLYIAGMKMKRGSALNMWETILMFFFTAGISLNNGLKVFLAGLMTRNRRFFRPGYLILAVLLPSALMWGFARWEYHHYVWPKEQARNVAKAKKAKAEHDAIRMQVADSIGAKDSAKVDEILKKAIQQKEAEKKRRARKQVWSRNTGKPIAKGEFMRWTDITTSRWDAVVENMFGEGIQLHADYLLGDVLRNRPVVVRYRTDYKGCYLGYVNYTVEAVIVLLALCGVWCGKRSRFLWTALSFFLMDMALHIGLGFGINEIYIMSPHYLFVLPIATAFLLKNVRSGSRWRLYVGAIAVITLWCWIWNITLICTYMMN